MRNHFNFYIQANNPRVLKEHDLEERSIRACLKISRRVKSGIQEYITDTLTYGERGKKIWKIWGIWKKPPLL